MKQVLIVNSNSYGLLLLLIPPFRGFVQKRPIRKSVDQFNFHVFIAIYLSSFIPISKSVRKCVKSFYERSPTYIHF